MHVTIHTDLAETAQEHRERLAKQKVGSREGCHPAVLEAQKAEERKRIAREKREKKDA